MSIDVSAEEGAEVAVAVGMSRNLTQRMVRNGAEAGAVHEERCGGGRPKSGAAQAKRRKGAARKREPGPVTLEGSVGLYVMVRCGWV